MPKLAAALLASIVLGLVVAPSTQASAHKDPRSCGTLIYPDLGAPAVGEGGEHGAAYETVAVVKGPANCKEAREIARKDPYAADSALPYTRKGWHCRYNVGCSRESGDRITARYRYETGRQKIEKRGARVEDEECKAQTFPSLSCEEKGFGGSEVERQRQQEREWYAECEHARENEQELSEEGPRTPTPAEAKADCKAEHERDERENA